MLLCLYAHLSSNDAQRNVCLTRIQYAAICRLQDWPLLSLFARGVQHASEGSGFCTEPPLPAKEALLEQKGQRRSKPAARAYWADLTE